MTEITVRFDLSFSRRFLSAAGALAIMLCAVPELDSESVTLSTYYPAPSGVYTNMITTGNTYLARDGGSVGIGSTAPGAAKLYVRDTDNAATPDIAQFFASNLTQGLGIGYNRIQAVGSNSDQDILLVPKGSGGRLTVTGVADFASTVISRQTCTSQTYGAGVVNCPSGRYATYTSGVLVKLTTTVGTTDPGGTMLCCLCPTGGCPSL